MVDLSQKIFERKQSDPTKCKAVIMRGNAMAPEIKDEDRVAIDTTKTRVYDDGVFAVMINGDLFIRRVLRLPGGGFKLLADKDPRLTQEVTADMADSVTILGEMIWRGG